MTDYYAIRRHMKKKYCKFVAQLSNDVNAESYIYIHVYYEYERTNISDKSPIFKYIIYTQRLFPTPKSWIDSYFAFMF